LGVVIKQSSISAIFTYIGAFIGFVNTIILFPNFLSTEQIGLIKALPSAAFLIVPFAQLGVGQMLLKFAPELKKKTNGLSQLISFSLIMVVSGSLITLLFVQIFNTSIFTYFAENAPLVNDYFYVISALILILCVHSLFEFYSRIFLKIIAQNIIKEILIRLGYSLLVAAYYLQYISFDTMITGIIGIYGTALITLIVYIYWIGELKFTLNFSHIDKSLLKRIGIYALFVIIGSSSNNIVLNVDQLMIASMINLSANGVYATTFYFAVVIDLSRRAIMQITTPLVSEAMESNDMNAVEKIYKQASINQMAIGILFFIGLTCNLDNLFGLMTNGDTFAQGKYVVYFIGLAKLVDMTFSNNNAIITMSKYYRFNVITIAILAGLMIGLNLVLIPIYGISGAAFASMLAMLVFGIIKMVFIKMKFDMIPFTWKNFHLLLIGVTTFYIGMIIPQQESLILDLMMRSSVIALIFCPSIYFFKISEEINMLFDKFIAKVLK
jgi:O-antigen/teichoic acid export membrane protein